MADFVWASLRIAIISLPLSGCVTMNVTDPSRQSLGASGRPNWGQSLDPQRGQSLRVATSGDRAPASSDRTSRGHSSSGQSGGLERGHNRAGHLARGQAVEQVQGRNRQRRSLQDVASDNERLFGESGKSVRAVTFEEPFSDEPSKNPQGSATDRRPNSGMSSRGGSSDDNGRSCEYCQCSPLECDFCGCEASCPHPIERLKSRLQMLAIPLPGCYYDWQEKRHLPEGPERASFHPLPTRPMFMPSSSGANLEEQGRQLNSSFGDCNYGQIPEGNQWYRTSTAEANIAP